MVWCGLRKRDVLKFVCLVPYICKLVTFRGAPLEDLKSCSVVTVEQAIALGWRCVRNGLGYYWGKSGVRFIHMNGWVVEVFEFQHYRDFDVKNRLVVDIGAGVGETAIYFLLRGARKVIAFEPCPNSYREMLANLRFNKAEDRVLPINAAVWGSAQELLVLCPRRTRVVAVPLKIVLKHLKRRVAVKMDCEGCEYESLKSLDRESARCVEEFFIEYHGDPEPIRAKLEDLGFVVGVRRPWKIVNGIPIGFIKAIR